MRVLKTPNGDGPNALDIMQPGIISELELSAETPTEFPPADKYPRGGVLSIRVPAGAVVRMHIAGGSAGYTLDPGHWSFGFDGPGEVELVADDDHVIEIMSNKEVQ
jgi:hypothetical protein